MTLQPIMIAIAGGSGSGKSTLAHAVRDALGEEATLLLHHDSYYKDLSHLPLEARETTNFDHPRSLDNELLVQHLDRLRDGRSVEDVRYDFVSHTQKPSGGLLLPRRFVVVEGILLLSDPAIASRANLRVFVDAPADIRFIRRQERDVAERGRTWDSVCAQYLTSVRPMHEQFVEPSKAVADLIVSGVEDIHLTTLQLARAVRAVEASRNAESSMSQPVGDP